MHKPYHQRKISFFAYTLRTKYISSYFPVADLDIIDAGFPHRPRDTRGYLASTKGVIQGSAGGSRW